MGRRKRIFECTSSSTSRANNMKLLKPHSLFTHANTFLVRFQESEGKPIGDRLVWTLLSFDISSRMYLVASNKLETNENFVKGR